MRNTARNTLTPKRYPFPTPNAEVERQLTSMRKRGHLRSSGGEDRLSGVCARLKADDELLPMDAWFATAHEAGERALRQQFRELVRANAAQTSAFSRGRIARNLHAIFGHANHYYWAGALTFAATFIGLAVHNFLAHPFNSHRLGPELLLMVIGAATVAIALITTPATVRKLLRNTGRKLAGLPRKAHPWGGTSTQGAPAWTKPVLPQRVKYTVRSQVNDDGLLVAVITRDVHFVAKTPKRKKPPPHPECTLPLADSLDDDAMDVASRFHEVCAAVAGVQAHADELYAAAATRHGLDAEGVSGRRAELAARLMSMGESLSMNTQYAEVLNRHAERLTDTAA